MRRYLLLRAGLFSWALGPDTGINGAISDVIFSSGLGQATEFVFSRLAWRECTTCASRRLPTGKSSLGTVSALGYQEYVAGTGTLTGVLAKLSLPPSDDWFHFPSRSPTQS